MKEPLNRERTAVAEQPVTAVDNSNGHDEPRGTIAEWTITILLLLFGTTTLVQAFVIPTGSMEDTLLIGDHLLVDKLAYAPAGSGQQVHPALRGRPSTATLSCFAIRWTLRQTFVKRVIGVPGDASRS